MLYCAVQAVERGRLPAGSDKSDHDLSAMRSKILQGRQEFLNKSVSECFDIASLQISL